MKCPGFVVVGGGGGLFGFVLFCLVFMGKLLRPAQRLKYV